MPWALPPDAPERDLLAASEPLRVIRRYTIGAAYVWRSDRASPVRDCGVFDAVGPGANGTFEIDVADDELWSIHAALSPTFASSTVLIHDSIVPGVWRLRRTAYGRSLGRRIERRRRVLTLACGGILDVGRHSGRRARHSEQQQYLPDGQPQDDIFSKATDPFTGTWGWA